jgi:hypothetical protein
VPPVNFGAPKTDITEEPRAWLARPIYRALLFSFFNIQNQRYPRPEG